MSTENLISIAASREGTEVDTVKVMAIEKVPNGYLIRAGQGEVISVHLNKDSLMSKVIEILA